VSYAERLIATWEAHQAQAQILYICRVRGSELSVQDLKTKGPRCTRKPPQLCFRAFSYPRQSSTAFLFSLIHSHKMAAKFSAVVMAALLLLLLAAPLLVLAGAGTGGDVRACFNVA